MSQLRKSSLTPSQFTPQHPKFFRSRELRRSIFLGGLHAPVDRRSSVVGISPDFNDLRRIERVRIPGRCRVPEWTSGQRHDRFLARGDDQTADILIV
jgi:hypothetical protein